MSDERQSLITVLDVVYGDGNPWYGSERLSPRDGRFKIMQIAHPHFFVGTGLCRDPPTPCDGGAYAYTESLVERALDEEQPDLVVFTGDQLNGQGTSWDTALVLAKFTALVISRRLVWLFPTYGI